MQQPEAIRAVIFDFGGVIMRTEDRQPRAALAERFGKTSRELETIVFGSPLALDAECGRVVEGNAWQGVASALGMPETEIPEFTRQFFGGDRVDFDLVAWIRQLRPARATALLSNTWMTDLAGYLARVGIPADTFDYVVSSAQCGVRKPDPQIFRMLLEMLRVRPEQAVFVDDFLANVQAAAALGMHTVHFQSAAQATGELERMLQTA